MHRAPSTTIGERTNLVPDCMLPIRSMISTVGLMVEEALISMLTHTIWECGKEFFQSRDRLLGN